MAPVTRCRCCEATGGLYLNGVIGYTNSFSFSCFTKPELFFRLSEDKMFNAEKIDDFVNLLGAAIDEA